MNEGAPTAKRALFITPSFFGYERDIASELAAQGYETTVVDERPSNSAWTRAVVRVKKSVLATRIDRYFRGKAADLAEVGFDKVIVVKAEVVPRWFLEGIRATNPDAQFIFYTFDSLENAPNCLGLLDLFDEAYTFDRSDAAQTPQLQYLPLFYTRDFHPRPHHTAAAYDVSFVGTLHSGRYAFATAIAKHFERRRVHFFVQAKWYFFIIKYLTREQRHVAWGEVSFHSLTRTEVAEVFRSSRAVLDMQREGQQGLTMRTFEVLASGAILVTTNVAIRQEPFYDDERVVVVEPPVSHEAAREVAARLKGSHAPVGPPPGFAQYSLASWVSALTAG